MSEKICGYCNVAHSGKRKTCNPCSAKLAREYRIKNPLSTKLATDKWHKNNPEKVRECHRWANIKRYYGISKSQYFEMLEKQSGSCAICGTKTANGPGKKFMVDHCHTSGKIRGLLCSNCNFLVGHSKESITTLEKTIKYLKG